MKSSLILLLTTVSMLHGQLSTLTHEQVDAFAELALTGIPQEYPNKPSNMMATAEDVLSPRAMHPAFFGSFDWHSSVHGHWMLVRLLRTFPDAPSAGKIRALLDGQFTAEKMQAEANYFKHKHNTSFERMYGWAWALQLANELHSWKGDADARRWAKNFAPLEKIITSLTKDYLPKLTWPVRTGVHQDTGFALALTLDYARAVADVDLEKLIIAKSREFYLNDRDYPVAYEPSGNDFFSSGLNEADLMRRVLTQAEFPAWLGQFLPGIRDQKLGNLLTPAEVSDVTDGHLVHLAGLNSNRTWCFNGIASALPEDDPRAPILRAAAKDHLAKGMAYVFSGHYEGEHWLATFAVYALATSE
jgi:hypothetical protein